MSRVEPLTSEFEEANELRAFRPALTMVSEGPILVSQKQRMMCTILLLHPPPLLIQPMPPPSYDVPARANRSRGRFHVACGGPCGSHNRCKISTDHLVTRIFTQTCNSTITPKSSGLQHFTPRTSLRLVRGLGAITLGCARAPPSEETYPTSSSPWPLNLGASP
jgi:hypothetical protein